MNTIYITLGIIITLIFGFKLGKWVFKPDFDEQEYQDKLLKVSMQPQFSEASFREKLKFMQLEHEPLKFKNMSYYIIDFEHGYIIDFEHGGEYYSSWSVKLENITNPGNIITVDIDIIQKYLEIQQKEQNKFENLPIEQQEHIKTTLQDMQEMYNNYRKI